MTNEEEYITISNLPAYAGVILDGANLKNMQRGDVLEGKIIPNELGTHALFDFNGERRYSWYEDFARATRLVSESADLKTHEGTSQDGSPERPGTQRLS